MNKTVDNDREIITGATETEWLDLRTHDITSTDAAALFGISPYLTPFELWHRKKNKTVVALELTERMSWGTRLQDAIAAGVCQDNGWTEYRRKDEYIRLLKIPMGSSFDFEFTYGGALPLLEIKNVDSLAFKEGWLIDGDNVEAPPHIELQVQHQLAVAGRERAYIAALIGGNRVVLIQRERDEHIIGPLIDRVRQFWDTIDKNIEPKPDFQKDAKFIGSLYRYSEPGKVMQATPEITTLCLKYKSFKAVATQAEKDAQGIKAHLLTLIGDAEKVIGDATSISAGMIGPTHVEYDREGYRDFRVNLKKIKEAIK